MKVQLVRVIREVTEHSPKTRQQDFIYSDVHQPRAGSWQPNTDIYETDSHVCIHLELAGVQREDITIKVTDGRMIVQGTRAPLCRQVQVNRYHQMEINNGEFMKTFLLPQFLEHNEITAEFKDGILTIYISKQDEPVEIPIRDEYEKGSQII